MDKFIWGVWEKATIQIQDYNQHVELVLLDYRPGNRPVVVGMAVGQGNLPHSQDLMSYHILHSTISCTNCSFLNSLQEQLQVGCVTVAEDQCYQGIDHCG